MEHYSNPWQVNTAEYDLFGGLDTDKGSTSVTIRDQVGLGRSIKMPSDPEVLLSFVRKEYPDKRIVFAYEAGPTGFGLYDAITAITAKSKESPFSVQRLHLTST